MNTLKEEVLKVYPNSVCYHSSENFHSIYVSPHGMHLQDGQTEQEAWNRAYWKLVQYGSILQDDQ